MKDNYTSLLIAGVMLVAVSQTLEGIASPAARFGHGVLIGLSIVCSVLGLILYVRPSKKQ
jgi:hypothetical protein